MLGWDVTIQQELECYNITREQEINDPRDLHIPQSKGNYDMGGHEIEYSNFLKPPLKTRKVNIGLEENRKNGNIGDYWDDEIVGKITKLFRSISICSPLSSHKWRVPLVT